MAECLTFEEEVAGGKQLALQIPGETVFRQKSQSKGL